MRALAITTALAAALAACSAGSNATPAGEGAHGGAADSLFCADSAYARVAEQVALGPRTPGSDAARECAERIAALLDDYGADSTAIHEAGARRFDGQPLRLRNVFARFGADDGRRRILLLAHYDTRPWADMEADAARRMQPIPGANDGASGTGVLLEIARALGRHPARVGVDMLFVDGEDSGYSDAIAPAGTGESADTWCLGTQAWFGTDPYRGSTAPAYAILLDMVGGAGARFHREQFSDAAAARVVDRLWAEAAALGYGDIFVDATGGAVVDDHIYVSRAGIPAVDIIEHMHPATGSFAPVWHTHADNMDNIDPATLRAAGHTVLSLIYKEK